MLEDKSLSKSLVVVLGFSENIRKQLPNPWHSTKSSPNRKYYLKKENSNLIKSELKSLQAELMEVKALHPEITEVIEAILESTSAISKAIPDAGSIRSLGDFIVLELNKISVLSEQLSQLVAEKKPTLEKTLSPLLSPPSEVSEEGKFYVYQAGLYRVTKERPSNQSDLKNLRKIAQRLRRLSKDPETKLTPIQASFVSRSGMESLKELGIDIAHNVAISEIMKAIAERLNNPTIEKDVVAEDFIDEILSSDDEEGRRELKGDFSTMRDPEALPKQKIQLADKISRRINRATRNLAPGHLSTNRSIQEKRDPHLVMTEGGLREHERSRRIASVAKKFLLKPDGVSYGPDTQKNPKTRRKQAKSSSAGKNGDNPVFDYDSPTEEEYKRSPSARIFSIPQIPLPPKEVLPSRNLCSIFSRQPISPLLAKKPSVDGLKSPGADRDGVKCWCNVSSVN